MKIKYFPGVLFAAFSMAFSLFGQTSATIYDPLRKDLPKVFTDAEEKLVMAKVVPMARIRWKDTGGCDEAENFNITGAASGAFTRKAARQRAILYELCQTGNGFANNGLVIIEAGKIVAHFVSEGGWNLNVISLPDIIKNGFDELAIETSGGMHQGYSGTSVTMLEVSASAGKELGWFLAYTNECENSEPGEYCDRSYKITAQPAAAPVFYQQKYDNAGTDEITKWVVSGKRTAIKSKKGNFKYLLIK
ncbi:MAG: hypothetical protein WKF92_11740 [Pyrinomonadaceae bacterium]